MSWGIAALATGGVILRPWKLPEWIWAVAGAALLVLTGLLPAALAWQGILRGTDVYLFLTGMMLLAELARREGVFDWLAGHAARAAGGSAPRLFALIYLVGIVVTAFLSNDATAVVMTPAVVAAARAARVPDALPYLLICAFIANAASFVLPISNPANLVIYGSHMPKLLHWLAEFALPSVFSIAATYAVLRLTQRRALGGAIATDIRPGALCTGGRIAAAGIVIAAACLMGASALGWPLGLPTAIAGAGTAAVVLAATRSSPLPVVQAVPWGVLPLVAGLFVLVEALAYTDVIEDLAGWVHQAASQDPMATAWGVGGILAIAGNLMNNLPAGLIAGTAMHTMQVPPAVIRAGLIGVDLGPNLSVTGSLATILWLTSLRREGITVSPLAFLKLGAVAMPVALVPALAAALLFH